MTDENRFKIKGVIFSVGMQEDIRGTKDPTKTYRRFMLTLEVKSTGYKKRGDKQQYGQETHYIKFERFEPRFDTDLYNKEDPVEIDFYIEGKPYKKTKGDNKGEEALWNKNIITKIKHLDRQVAKTGNMDFQDNKITVTSMSDINTIGDPPKDLDDPFSEVKTNINPLKIDIEEDDLPF